MEGRLAVLLAVLLHETGQDVSLEMVHHNQRNVQRNRERLGEGSADEQRAEQAGAAREGYGRKVFSLHSGARQRLAHDRNDVQFMGARRQFRHHSPERLVHRLAGDDVREQVAVTDDGR